MMWPPPPVEPSPVAAKPTAGAAVVKPKEKEPFKDTAVSALTYKYVELKGMQLGKRLTRKKNITPDSMQGAAS